MINRSGNQLFSGINEVLHLSKFEVGNTTFCEQAQSLNEWLGALEQRSDAVTVCLSDDDVAVILDAWVTARFHYEQIVDATLDC